MKSTDILKQIENNKNGSLLKSKKQKNTPGLYIFFDFFKFNNFVKK